MTHLLKDFINWLKKLYYKYYWTVPVFICKNCGYKIQNYHSKDISLLCKKCHTLVYKAKDNFLKKLLKKLR
jgi:hypothetical protein